MNIGEFLKRFEGGKGTIRIGGDMECVFKDSCPQLSCTGKRNLRRALYHKIRYIHVANDGKIAISISPFYDESRDFTLLELLAVSMISDIQIDSDIRLVGLDAILAFIKTNNPILDRVVKCVSIIEGAMIITLTPSIDDILSMLT